MPDDNENKVTETEEEEIDEFSAVFNEEEETEEKTDEIEESEETTEGEEETEETTEKEADEEEPEEEEKEEDTLLTRGKEILEAEEKERQEKEDAEKKALEEADKKKAQEAATRPLNKTDMTNLMGIVDKDEIPNEEFKINGVSINPREFIDDNPEALVVGGLMAVKTINRMTQTGALVTGKILQKQLEEQQNTIWGNTYAAMVTMWHSDADELVQSDGYSKWLDNQKDEVKALVKSGNPLDLINVINRYKENQITTEDAAKNKEEQAKAKAEAKAKKEKHDRLIKNIKPKKTPAATLPGLDDIEEVDDEFSAGFNS